MQSEVQSDEDLSTGKWKEGPIDHEESMKKKRKKKQITTPRPSCSWVHFSREFIKDYRASHPESSGLKAATKAASEAWKLMSLEEKAKYTARAREVWDSYLSSTPREPKPRQQTKLVTRCSPGRLLNVLKKLSPEQKDAVKSMGFGSLLDLRCRTLRRSLCLWLLERFNTVRRSLEICGERIPLSPHDVELVMGFSSTGKDMVRSGPEDSIIELRKKYNASNRGISVRLLEEILESEEAGDDFKRSFVLYVLGTLLCPTARLDVSPSFLHFLTNMDVVHQFNWGKFLLDRLVREVSRFQQGKQRAVGGCLLFLQLFYYESVAIEGLSDSPSAVVLPYSSLWGEEEIAEREKRERELGGYGLGEVICKERGLGRGTHNDMEDSVGVPCHITEMGSTATTIYMKKNNNTKASTDGQCSCPLGDCKFTGLPEAMSLHFSNEHLDSRRRFKYDNPFTLSLGTKETLFLLQAEEDGRLFLLHKVTETVGYTVRITFIGPTWSKEHFSCNIVSERGTGSLRLISDIRSFTERTPPIDFMLIPSNYVDSYGLLYIQVCINMSENRGAECLNSCN